MANVATIERLVTANEPELARLYTKQGVELMHRTARGRRRTRYNLDPRLINGNFLIECRNVYNLTEPVDPLSLYRESLETSAAVQINIQRGVFPSHFAVGIHNEVEIPHTDTSLRLARVAGIRGKIRVDEQLRWHSLTDILFTHGASLIHAQNRETGLGDALGSLHDWVAERLYSGDEGEIHPFPYNSFHDPITNKTLRVGSADEVAESPIVTRVHLMQVRHARRLGFVHSYARLKGETAVEKMMDYALTGDGVFRPEKVRDKGGIMMIATGGRPMRDKLMHRVREILEKHPEKNGDIEEDHYVGVGRGQNPIEWKRIKFPMGDLESIEFVFKALIDYRDQEDHVGDFDASTGELNGDGHDAFMRRRKIRLIRACYPPFVYKPQDLDIEELIRLGGEELVHEMMSRDILRTKIKGNNGKASGASHFRSLPAPVAFSN